MKKGNLTGIIMEKLMGAAITATSWVITILDLNFRQISKYYGHHHGFSLIGATITATLWVITYCTLLCCIVHM